MKAYFDNCLRAFSKTHLSTCLTKYLNTFSRISLNHSGGAILHTVSSGVMAMGLGTALNLMTVKPCLGLGFTGDFATSNWVTTYGGSTVGDTTDGYLDVGINSTFVTVTGPANQTGVSSYINWAITMPNTAPVYTISFTWTFTGDDLTANDDKAYYVLNGATTLLASWNAQFDNNGIPTPITANKTIVLTSGQTLGFQVVSIQNRPENDPDYDAPGYLKIENFDVQTSIPFEFDPRSGIVSLGVLWGIYYWGKKKGLVCNDTTTHQNTAIK